MNSKSREKLLAGIAALSLLGISPQQTFAAQITTNQAVQQTKKITGTVTDAMGPIIGATVKVKVQAMLPLPTWTVTILSMCLLVRR